MEILSGSKKILIYVIDEKAELSVAFKKTLDKVTSTDRKTIMGISGMALRNYFLVRHFANIVFNTDDTDDIAVIGLCFVSIAFKKYYNEKTVREFFAEHFKEKGVELTTQLLESFEKLIKLKKGYVFEDIQKGTLEFFSIRFNLPIWFLKLILRQFNRDSLIQIANECSKMPDQYAIINPFADLIDKDNEELKNYTNTFGSVYKYSLPNSIKSSSVIRNRKLLPVQLAAVEYFDNLPKLNHCEISIYLDSKDYAFYGIFEKYAKENTINFFVKDMHSMFDVVDSVKKLPMPKFQYHESAEDGLIAYVSNKQDIIFYYPKNSSFDQFRRIPDYGVCFDPETFDELIDVQSKGLEDLSKNVIGGGYLVYAVNTIDIKETSLIIYKFLEKHKEFKEVKSLISFPFDFNNSMYFYSILRKGK